MEPKTISEQLMFNTVRLTTNSGSSGTGFFYDFIINDQVYPTIITNKHVINNNPTETMTFYLHLKTGEKSSNESIKVTYKANWIFHSTHDLCFCFVNPLFEHVKCRTGKDVFYVANDASVVATTEKLEKLSAIEELMMVGYPIGLWDEKNNFPIFRKGFTASHPAFDFNEKGIGLADMACFPGSSGSPIYILNEGAYTNKDGGMVIGHRVILIGILYAGPHYNAHGDIVAQTIPTQQNIQTSTPIMINLGYYIKATELKEFEDYILKNI